MIPLQYQFLAKFIALLAVAASASYGAWYVTSNHYETVIAQHAASDAAAVMAELERQQKLSAERAEKSRIAEEQHAKDQLVINRLGNQLTGVRVHVPTIGCSALPGAGQTAADSDGTSRAFSERMDAAFAELQSGIGELVQRCDQLNIDAIAANRSSP